MPFGRRACEKCELETTGLTGLNKDKRLIHRYLDALRKAGLPK